MYRETGSTFLFLEPCLPHVTCLLCSYSYSGCVLISKHLGDLLHERRDEVEGRVRDAAVMLRTASVTCMKA